MVHYIWLYKFQLRHVVESVSFSTLQNFTLLNLTINCQICNSCVSYLLGNKRGSAEFCSTSTLLQQDLSQTVNITTPGYPEGYSIDNGCNVLVREIESTRDVVEVEAILPHSYDYTTQLPYALTSTHSVSRQTTSSHLDDGFYRYTTILLPEENDSLFKLILRNGSYSGFIIAVTCKN